MSILAGSQEWVGFLEPGREKTWQLRCEQRCERCELFMKQPGQRGLLVMLLPPDSTRLQVLPIGLTCQHMEARSLVILSLDARHL